MKASVRLGGLYAAQSFFVGILLTCASFSYAQFNSSGSFDVLPNGAATYTLPIQLPQGVAGVMPELALTYNSYAGDGPLGVGWSLSGLSRISRCPKTIYLDGMRNSANFDTVNFDENDRFCLDGKRLIKIGSVNGVDEYKLEFDDLSKITSTNSSSYAVGPTDFTIVTKEGLVVKYAPFKLLDSDQFAYEWMVSKITDRRGNTIIYSLSSLGEAAGQIGSIIYTSASSLSANIGIYFSYTAKSVSRYGYKSGRKFNYSNSLLTKISVSVGASTAKSILFSYNIPPVGGKLSTLESIQECGSSGGCLMPLRFKSNAAAASLQSLKPSGTTKKLEGAPLTDASFYTIDVNRDGASDIVALYPTSNYQVTSTAVWFSDKNGGFTNSGVTSNVGGWAADRKYFTFDVNDDDKLDFVEVYQCGSNACATAWLSNGVGAFAKATGESSVIGRWAGRFFVVPGWTQLDMDADKKMKAARTGLLVIQPDDSSLLADGTPESYAMQIQSLGNGLFEQSSSTRQLGGWGGKQTHMVFDVNGDGFSDIVKIHLNGTINQAFAEVWLYDPSANLGQFRKAPYISDIGWFGDAERNNEGIKRFYSSDMNGDGLQDIVSVRLPDDGCNGAVVCTYVTETMVLLSKGNGSFEKKASTYFTSGGSSSNYIQGLDGVGVRQYFVDVDGDGLPEFIQRHNKLIATAKFNINSVIDGKMELIANNDVELTMDADANGLPDIALINKSTGVVNLYGYKDDVRNYMREMDNGLGSKLIIESAVPSKYYNSKVFLDRNVAFPYRHILPGAWMTFASAVQQGNGLSLQNEYRYGNPLVELGFNGRGFLGFQWFEKTTNPDSTNRIIKNKTYFHQTYPYLGRVERQTLGFGGSSDNLSITNFKYDFCGATNTGMSSFLDCSVSSNFNGATKDLYVLIEKTELLESSKDLNSKPLPGKKTIFDYYGFGSPYKGWLRSSTVSGLNADNSLSGYGSSNSNVYEVDASGVVKLKSSTVTSSKP